MKSALSSINQHQESRLSLKPFSTPSQTYLSLQALSIFGTLWQRLPCPPIAICLAGVGRLGRQPRRAQCGAAAWEDAGSPHRQPRLHHCRRIPSGAGVGQPDCALSLHSQTSKEGGYSSTGAPKWPTSASESTAFSVGLVIAYRREKQKNQVCSQLADMWHLLLWAEWKRI